MAESLIQTSASPATPVSSVSSYVVPVSQSSTQLQQAVSQAAGYQNYTQQFAVSQATGYQTPTHQLTFTNSNLTTPGYYSQTKSETFISIFIQFLITDKYLFL